MGGYHEGSNEIMLALYKLNEVLFNANVVYPFKIFNQEAQKYEYREKAFTAFNPNHKIKYDKPWGESGFFRSNIENINEYFDKYKDIQKLVLIVGCKLRSDFSILSMSFLTSFINVESKSSSVSGSFLGVVSSLFNGGWSRFAASKMRFRKSGKFLQKKNFQLAKVATRLKLGCFQVSRLLKRKIRGQRPLI